MIGIDIVENQRMKYKDEKFIKRILSSKEYDFFINYNLEQRKIEYLSSRFAAKEAIFKVYKVGINDMSYDRISILNDSSGAPFIEIDDKRISELEISLSHEKNYCVAIVIKTK